jgi:hypothetical protein
MKCSKCKEKAITYLKPYRIALCKNCYPNFYLNLVNRSIKKYKIIRKNEKILACVSGGKDSSAMAFALKKLGYDIEILHIDLGIGEYSAKSRKVVEELAEEIDVPTGADKYFYDNYSETWIGIKMDNPDALDIINELKNNGFVELKKHRY